MIFEKGFYTHKNFKDVFIEVIDVVSKTDQYVLLKMLWWNRGQMGKPFVIAVDKNPFCTLRLEFVTKESYADWKQCDEFGNPRV